MKCPNCDTQIPGGYLYCPKCGEEIKIVPEFEFEVEEKIESSINIIAEDLNDVDFDTSASNEDTNKSPKGKKKISKPKVYIYGIVAAVVCCIFFAAYGAKRNSEYNSFSFQLDKARECQKSEKYDAAIKYYKRALELSADEERVGIELALCDIYFLLNEHIEYEYYLREVVAEDTASFEDLKTAYGKLIAIYCASENYSAINDILLDSNEELMATYKGYVSLPPVFSVKGGYYTEDKPLILSDYGDGDIYYTMDGTNPDENSEKYFTPIILTEGEYVISAVYVNQYGVYSDIVRNEYHVELEKLEPPNISTVSGDYNFPINIELVDDTSDIYYTTDGSVPDQGSNVYKGAIPMPLGKTTYKFMRIKGNKTSEIVERSYNLVMNTEYTNEQARKDLVDYFYQCGKIYDEFGHFDDSGSQYIFEYLFVTNINNIDDFYVFAEVLRLSDGSVSRTGNYYAVNAYTGKLYILDGFVNNNYHLVEI